MRQGHTEWCRLFPIQQLLASTTGVLAALTPFRDNAVKVGKRVGGLDIA